MHCLETKMFCFESRQQTQYAMRHMQLSRESVRFLQSHCSLSCTRAATRQLRCHRCPRRSTWHRTCRWLSVQLPNQMHANYWLWRCRRSMVACQDRRKRCHQSCRWQSATHSMRNQWPLVSLQYFRTKKDTRRLLIIFFVMNNKMHYQSEQWTRPPLTTTKKNTTLRVIFWNTLKKITRL